MKELFIRFNEPSFICFSLYSSSNSFENNKFYREVSYTGAGKELNVHVLVPLENIIDYLEDFRNDDPHKYGDYISPQ